MKAWIRDLIVKAQINNAVFSPLVNRSHPVTQCQIGSVAVIEHLQKESVNAAKYPKMLEIVWIILFHRLDDINDGT